MPRAPFYVCDGPACRLRARDLELPADAHERVPCLGRCDAPVAAFTVEDAAARTLARELTLSRRGFAAEPTLAPGAQRGAHEPLLLRDLFLVDQAELETARRRGAYRSLGALPADLAQLIATATDAWSAEARAATVVVTAGAGAAGQFALRPVFERDPHAVIEGALVAAHAAGATEAVIELRAEWIEAHRVMARALADAGAAELTDGIALRLSSPAENSASASASASGSASSARASASATATGELRIAGGLALALRHILANGASWWRDHAALLCALSGDVARPGVYELERRATVADAIAAGGGVVDGVRTSTLGGFWSDGARRPPARAGDPAPSGLIIAHARRDLAAVERHPQLLNPEKLVAD